VPNWLSSMAITSALPACSPESNPLVGWPPIGYSFRKAFEPLLLPVIARAHAFQFLEEVAEVKLAGEVHLLGDLLDGQPWIRQQHLRVFQAAALDKTVKILAQHREEQRPQPGVTDAGNAGQLLHLPVVIGLGFHRVEDPNYGSGQVGRIARERVPRIEQGAKHFSEEEVDLPLPTWPFAAANSPQVAEGFVQRGCVL